MRTRSKLLLTALTAAIVLSAGVGNASALNSIGASPTAITGTASVVFRSSNNETVRCLITLTGTLNSRIAKNVGTTIGTITGAALSSQAADNISFANVTGCDPLESIVGTYRSFEGTLPNILAINITFGGLVGFRLLFSDGGNALYGTDTGVVSRAFSSTGAANSIDRITMNETPATKLKCSGFFSGCAASASGKLVTSTFTIAPRVTLTLH